MAWVRIKDYHSIESLADALSTTGSATATVVEAFTDYLRQCIDEILRIQAGLTDAKNLVERELAEAQSELESCRWSQEWDEEECEYYPSCDEEEDRRDELQVQYDTLCKAYDSVTDNLKECEWRLKRWLGDTMPSDPLDQVGRIIAAPAAALVEVFEPTGGYQKAKWCVELCEEGETRLSRIAQHCEKYNMIPLHPLNKGMRPIVPSGNDTPHADHVPRDIRIEGTGLHTMRCKHGYVQKKCPYCK